MKVFIIPSWHPIPGRPQWCNWIKPHIEMVRLFAETTILYVNSEDEHASSVSEIEDRFYYASLPKDKDPHLRTIFKYQKHLDSYIRLLSEMFVKAVHKYGKPDIIHAHVSMPAGYGASVIGKEQGIPVIVTEHYSGFFSDNRFCWRLPSFYRKMYRDIAGLYCVSPGFSDRASQKTGLKIAGLTPNPVNMGVFNMDNSRTYSKELRLCSTGNHSLRKGTDILFEALDLLPSKLECHLTLVGKPADRIEIPENVKSKSTFITESVSQTKLAEIYNSSDIYIMSSRHETANISMLEAMACGCHVVSNVIGSSETLLRDDVSTLFHSTPESLAQSITVAVMKLSARDRLNLSQYVRGNYSIEILSEKLKSIYISTITNYKS